jgi:8-oxo-dGTP diphosphatase
MQKQVVAVCAAIVNDKNEVFLTQRNQPGSINVHEKWQFPGGGIEFGEEPIAAVVREVQEETGFKVEVVELIPKIISNFFQMDFHAILIFYRCKIISGEFKTDDPETMDGRFFKKGEIDYEKCLPRTKDIIDMLGI